MISYNGQAAVSRVSMRKMQRNLRRAGDLAFMMPAIDAAARGAIDFALLTEPDGSLPSPAELPLLAVISAMTPHGRDPLAPAAWTAMRQCRSAPPALVVLDTLLLRAAWAAVVEEMGSLGSVVIVLCEPSQAPSWLAALKGVAPLRTLIAGQRSDGSGSIT